MNSFRDDDENESNCPYCGVYMEVIGPPGPQHKKGCPEHARVNSSPVPSTQPVSPIYPVLPTSLHQMFDDILMKHHGHQLEDWDVDEWSF